MTGSLLHDRPRITPQIVMEIKPRIVATEYGKVMAISDLPGYRFAVIGDSEADAFVLFDEAKARWAVLRSLP